MKSCRLGPGRILRGDCRTVGPKLLEDEIITKRLTLRRNVIPVTQPMKENHTKRRLLVSFDGDSAPHVIVPRAQAKKLHRLFEKNSVPHTVHQRGQESYSVFDLGHDADVRQVQAVLDGAA